MVAGWPLVIHGVSLDEMIPLMDVIVHHRACAHKLFAKNVIFFLSIL